MGDLKTQNTSYDSEVLDTATSCADGSVSGDEMVAALFNGIYGAVVAIENKLGVTTATNPSIKGTCASLAARLAYNTAAGGGIPSGTAFPTSPTPVDGQFFKRNDYSPTRLYFYDSSTAAWVRFSALLNHSDLGGLTSGDDHTQYVHNTTARTVSANHTFSGNPVLSGTPSFSHATGVSPFTVTSTTKVDNLHASKLTTAEAIVSTLATGTAPLTVASTTKVTNLNADLLDDMNSATTNTASTIVARDASGNFAAGTITAALTGNVTGNASGSSGSCTGNAATATTATRVTDGVYTIHTKILNMGVWDMDTTLNITIAHGLTFAKIRSIVAMVNNDAGAVLSDISAYGTAAVDGYCIATASNISVERTPGGAYDNTDYDNAVINRGFIVVTYVD